MIIVPQVNCNTYQPNVNKRIIYHCIFFILHDSVNNDNQTADRNDNKVNQLNCTLNYSCKRGTRIRIVAF